MSLSRYAAVALLNSIFGKTSNFGALASRPTVYVALIRASTTTSGSITTGATSVSVASASGISIGTQISLGPDGSNAMETVTVSNVSGTTLTVNATASGHASGAPVTINPTDQTTGTTIVEPTYTGYARVSTATTDWNTATSASPSTLTNANPVTFPAATGGTDNITWFALLDAATVGNMLAFGPLTALYVSATGNTPSFAAAQLTTSAS